MGETVAPNSGLPDPANLAGYEQVVKGSAKRMIALLEAEVHHRHQLQKEEQDAEILANRRGQIFALIITLTAIIGGTLAAILGNSVAGGSIAGVTVIALILFRLIAR